MPSINYIPCPWGVNRYRKVDRILGDLGYGTASIAWCAYGSSQVHYKCLLYVDFQLLSVDSPVDSPRTRNVND